ADGVRNGGVGQAGDGNDVPGGGLVETDALEPAKGEHFRHPALLDQLAGVVEHLDRLGWRDRTGGDTPGDDTAKIRIRLKNRTEQAERTLLDLGRGDMRQHEVEQYSHAEIFRALAARRHPALFRRAVQDGEVELLVRGIERGEQI